MTKNRTTMDKKKLTLQKNKNVSLQKKTKGKSMKSKKLKQMMKKRLIIRNLSFKVTEEQLKTIFSQFGTVADVSIPLNEAGKKRGFAFVRYEDSKSQIKAMKALNFKEICGRPIAIDLAVDKTTYQSQRKNKDPSLEPIKKENLDESKSDSDSDSKCKDFKREVQKEIKEENESDESSERGRDNGVKQFLREFDVDSDAEEIPQREAGSDSSDDSDFEVNESHNSDQNNKNVKEEPFKKRQSNDVSEGKTVFVRNVSYNTSEENLQEIMQEYGDIVYCLLCMDPVTDHPKGTAFVKFKEKESADKLVEESTKEPGILLDGRKLMCAYAISREELTKRQSSESEKVKDRRNLRLLKCGLIVNGSKESEGVSQADMAKRAQLEMMKKKKLRNVNFFVSDKRLAIHNLPKNINDKDLFSLFKRAAGKGATIKEARVMKDFKKTDSQGIPVSRGFGFISFTEHKHALEALNELNNNPNIFTSAKRPIVEFSVENQMALLTQERRREMFNRRHKRKLEEN